MAHRSKRRRPRKGPEELKDCLIQARVPRDLQSVLKEEAARRRLSVSHLIRNVLEDTFDLVDNVISEVDHLVQDSVGLATQVTRDASRVAQSATGRRDPIGERKAAQAPATDAEEARGPANPTTKDQAPASDAEPPADDPLAQVLAWQRVVLNRDAQCARCGDVLRRGAEANLGLGHGPAVAPTWLCARCLETL